MDRPVDSSYRRKKIIRKSALTILIFVSCLLLVSWGVSVLRPSVKRSRIRTAVVGTGDVLETIAASGVVMPEFEEVITSPISTKVLRIVKQPGDFLQHGDSLLVLDRHETELALNNINEQILLKHNQNEKVLVEFDIEMNDLKSQLESRKLRFEADSVKYEREKKLLDHGGISEEQAYKAKMEADIAKIEYNRVERSIENAQKLNRNVINSLELEIKILENDRREIKRQIELAETRVLREGVLTWIVEEEGASIGAGEIIARVADLKSYRVEARVSDVHTGRLMTGLQVLVRLSEETVLDGTVSNILPTIKNGIITFLVRIEDKTNELLRSNLRVDIYVVTDEKRDVLRIAKGPFAQGNGVHEVFVIRGERAVKTEAQFGISSFAFFEVVDGLSAGDEVIISDMKDRLYADELVIKR